MIFNIKKTIIKVVISICVFLMIISFLVPQTNFVTSKSNISVKSKTEVNESKTQIQKNFRSVDYTIKLPYSGPLKAKLIEANGKYSLIKTTDFDKIFHTKTKISVNKVTIQDENKTIMLMIDDPHLIGYAVKDGVLKRALFDIPYPAVMVNNEIYVPIRSVARAIGMGVIFDGKYIYVGEMKPIDNSLIFEKYVEE